MLRSVECSISLDALVIFEATVCWDVILSCIAQYTTGVLCCCVVNAYSSMPPCLKNDAVTLAPYIDLLCRRIYIFHNEFSCNTPVQKYVFPATKSFQLICQS